MPKTSPSRPPVRKIRRHAHGLSTPRNLAIAAGVVVTAVLILQLGIWYLFALLALYAAIDVFHRMEERREARVRMAILASADHVAEDVLFVGSARMCQEAAWVAKGLGWLACPMVRERFWRHSVRFKQVPGAVPLRSLLQSLNEQRLAAKVRLPANARTFGQRLAEQTYADSPARRAKRIDRGGADYRQQKETGDAGIRD